MSKFLGEQCIGPGSLLATLRPVTEPDRSLPRRPERSQSICGECTGLDFPVSCRPSCRAKSEGENHSGDQKQEPQDEEDDQGCLGSSRAQILAKEIEVFLARLFCERRK